MQELRISVIVVVQNGQCYLSKAIESIIKQTHQADEILVVDGHSTDNTGNIAKSYPNVRYINQQGKGLANARNTGIDNATGELIAFLDHDDYWTLDKLEVQIRAFTNSPNIQYSYANLKLFLESGCKLPNRFKCQQFPEYQVGRTPGTLLVRKSLFAQIGNFNPNFIIGCDVDWFARAKDDQISAAYIPQVLLHKRVHTNNLSANVRTNQEEIMQILKQSLQRQRQ
ncbi:glycosyltransferase [Cronbergia sp. UHCC 0137]|uniref:glycosyltransferase family 2 protein n=1 Tax=Cronbergia sp. UHCC 0137 TaxID=3110239 RepID=UPI002B1F3054|nr:glycosyltransferase [Cronbergia sp. UHCC 0137]MEA5619904.1 glycosyltransferase [Cronbergia sp. UHCC 0137]